MLATSVAACAPAGQPGLAIVGCDSECLLQGGAPCQEGMPVSSVTLASLCALNTQQPGCESLCINTGNYDLAVSAGCDAAGKCASLSANCGYYRCDQATHACKKFCGASTDCFQAQCIDGDCVP